MVMGITSPIFNMFGRSPIRPLQKHMSKAHECAQELLPFFDSVLAENWPSAQIHRNKIAELENEADEMKKDIRLHLPKGLFLPVPRNDLVELLIMQDRVANKVKDISGLMFGREMKIPSEIAEDFKVFLHRCIDAATQAQKAINELDELLEAGFRGNEVDLVHKMIVELDVIEHDTDEMQIDIRAKIFNLEDRYPPIDIIFLYKAIEWTGELADRAQTVGGQFSLLLAR